MGHAGERSREDRLVADIAAHEAQAVEPFEVRLLPLGEVVHDGDVVTVREEATTQVRPYEAGTTCDEHVHGRDP